MGRVYQYNLIPRDPLDLKRYCWSKLSDLQSNFGYDESGTRVSFGYKNSIYVINGYVENDTPVFAYRIDKKAFWLDEIKITLDLTPGVSSQCFVDAFNDPVTPRDVGDLKLIMRGKAIVAGGDTFYCMAKCVDEVFTGMVLIKFVVDDSMLIENKIQATVIALTYDPQVVIETEEIIDSLGIYNNKFYFIGKQPEENSWRNLWDIELIPTYPVGMGVLPDTNLNGRQSFAIIGRYCYVTGGFNSGSVPVWRIDLRDRIVTIVDYSTSTIQLPVPLLNPVMTTKGQQVLVLGPSQNKALVGEVVRLNTSTMAISALEELILDKKKMNVAAPVYTRQMLSVGEVIPVSDYIGTTDTVFRFDIVGGGLLELRKGDIFVDVFTYEGGNPIETDTIKFQVIGTFDPGDIIRIQCGKSVEQITANNGIADGIFHYYFDTRRCIMWVANIIDAVPLDPYVQLFEYECKFNGMVLMSDIVHSKIDNNKYITAYR